MNNFIKVWCEYDFSGSFGGNNNEEIFMVDSELSQTEIEELVLTKLSNYTGLTSKDLADLYDWTFVDIEKL